MIQCIFILLKLAGLALLSLLSQTGLTMSALESSKMPSLFFSSNVHQTTSHPGRPTPKPTILWFQIVPSLSGNSTKFPHLPHLPPPVTFPPSLKPLVLNPQAKAPVAAKKGSLTAQSTKALRPSVPPRPPQTMTTASSSTSPPLPVQAPIAPAAPPSLATTTPDDSQLPTAPLISSSPPPPQGVEASADIAMPPSSFPLPMSSLSGADKEKALRPLLHNATTISVQPAPLPVPVSRPLVHELYAQAFALLLPTIHTFYGLLTQKAKSLYDYLFNPAVTIIPEHEVDTTTDAPDAPMTDATTDETPPTPMEISPTPFSELVEEFVNLEASFEDPGRLSAPEIQPSDYSTEPLDAPGFKDSMLTHYHALLHYLHTQLSEYFSSVQDPSSTQNFFLTLIVGPPDHINARHCLHSHLIGCHVSPPQDCHSVLFVPIGSEGVWDGPLDWAPLLVYLLVTAPHTNFAHSRRYLPSTLFSLHSHHPPAAHVFISPPLNMSFEETIPPKEVIAAFSASRETHQQSCYTWRADLLDSHTVVADQHFPFYCTPYYGFSPPSLHDAQTMILELSTFLISFAFLVDGSPLPALDTAPPSPGSLLSPLSSIHPEYMSVYPGEGVFFLDNCPDPTSGDPMIVTWLASFARCPPPVPSLFPDMLTCLSPGDGSTMPALFANTLQLMEPCPIPLGPSAQLHLTSSLLPPPFLRPTAQLQLSASPCGGIGSLQYCHHFNPQDDDVSSLTDISWNSHHFPADFISDLFSYENWGDSGDAHLFFPPPITRPQNFLPFLSGVPRTPLTLPLTTP